MQNKFVYRLVPQHEAARFDYRYVSLFAFEVAILLRILLALCI